MRTFSSTVTALLLLCGCASTPKTVIAQRALGAELVRRGEWAAAYNVVGPLCRERPDDAEALTLRGIIYTEQRLLDEARADLEAAVRLAPKLAKAHSALGILSDIQGRGTDAIKHHRIATELTPADPSYLNNLGFSLFVNGRARDAVAVLSEALRAAPTDKKIRNNLAFAYAAAGDMTRAADHFALGGTPAEAKNNLGWAYERRGELTHAYEQYAAAVALDPGSTSARENLKRVSESMGRSQPQSHNAAAQGG